MTLKSVPRGAECPGSERRTRDVFAAVPGHGQLRGAARKTPRNGNLFLSRKLRTMETGLGSQEDSLPTVGFLCQSSETVNTKYRKSWGLGETVGKL